MNEDELKTCPFCGGEAAINAFFGEQGEYVYVTCRGCGAGGPGSRRDAAIAAWNRRAPPPATGDEARRTLR